ncbi:MAG TPA: exosome complex component Rrp42, partial [Acidilobales archaeon]|nr:exosome complex component Rrp42 [Acidilobales archaeon]
MTPSNQRIVSRLKKSSIVSLIKKGLRVDGRKLNEYREITIIP